ncbi:MAG: hypothetical protein M1823_007403, partial [Watsoniomyces obsoletus]
MSLHSQKSIGQEVLSPVHSVTASPVPPPAALSTQKSAEGVAPGVASETQDAASPESEITTNPSVIQGPIAGYDHGNRDHWPYGPTPPPVETDLMPGSNRDLGLVGPPDLVPEALSITHAPAPEGKRTIHIGGPTQHTSPGMIDEGYDTMPNAPSPASLPKERAMPVPVPFSPGLEMNDALDDEDDPFSTQKKK